VIKKLKQDNIDEEMVTNIYGK